MMIYHKILFILFLINGPLKAQTKSYDIFLKMNGTHIGWLETKAEKDTIHVKSHIKAAGIVDVQYNGLLVFNIDKKIISAKAEVFKNQKLVTKGTLSCCYQKGVQTCRDSNRILDKNVDFTTMMYYFKEPIGKHLIYQESTGKWAKVVNVSPGVYEVTIEDDSKNTYYYQNGQLTKALVKQGMFTILILPKK